MTFCKLQWPKTMKEWYWWIETSECEKLLRKKASSIFHDEVELEMAMECARDEVFKQCELDQLVIEPIPNNANELTKRHKAFLLTVLANEMRDWRRTQYGRPRPPQWINSKTCKLLWNEAFTQLCIMKRLIVETFEVLKQHQQNPECKDENLDGIIREILHRVKGCRNSKITFVSIDDDNGNAVHNNIPDPQAGIEYDLKQECKEAILTRLKLLLQPDSAIPPSFDGTCIQYLNLRLNDRQLMVLRLLHQDNLTLKNAATKLRLTTDQVRYAKDQALTALRQALREVGIDNMQDIEF